MANSLNSLLCSTISICWHHSNFNEARDAGMAWHPPFTVMPYSSEKFWKANVNWVSTCIFSIITLPMNLVLFVLSHENLSHLCFEIKTKCKTLTELECPSDLTETMVYLKITAVHEVACLASSVTGAILTPLTHRQESCTRNLTVCRAFLHKFLIQDYWLCVTSITANWLSYCPFIVLTECSQNGFCTSEFKHGPNGICKPLNCRVLKCVSAIEVMVTNCATWKHCKLSQYNSSRPTCHKPVVL